MVFFISHSHLTPMSYKGSTCVAYGNSFSKQWAFTLLKSELFKNIFLNIYITKTVLCILLTLVQLTLDKQ